MPRVRVAIDTLRQAQIDQALTAKELAALAEISESFLSRIYSGTRGVGPKTLSRLAHATGLPVRALVAADTTQSAA